MPRARQSLVTDRGRRGHLLRRGIVALWFVAFVGVVALGDGGAAAAQSEQKVLVAEIDGAITPVIAAHVDDAIERAARDGYDVLVLEIDTPGGLDSSMRAIVKDILDSPVPIVAFVAPSGARAASAGAFITLAAHVAAMAPGTAIGAATPVSGGGDDLDAKARNDAVAYAQSLAQLRGRSVEFATDAVRSARSASADEALRVGAIDVVAATIDDLLERIDGRTVQLGPTPTEVVLDTADARVDTLEMGGFRRVQQVLADPNIAFLLLSIATLGLVYELATPGLGAGGIIAAIGYVLAFFSLAVLPLDVVGVVFIVLGAALFVAEVFSPGLGVAAAGGALMFALGGVFLIDDTPGIEISIAAVLPITLATALMTIVASRFALRARAAPSTLTGEDALVGQTATVRITNGGNQAFVAGSWWRVRLPEGSLADGERVRVLRVEELALVVERTSSEAIGHEDLQPNQNEEAQ